MENADQFMRTLSEETLQKVTNVVSEFKKQQLIPLENIDRYEGEVMFQKDFLSGFLKLTFLIKGDPQVGKTTLLNCLLDDDIFMNRQENGINILQYDANCQEPELFTAQLQDLFNINKQVFAVRPEQLKKTGLKGRNQIKDFLSNTASGEQTRNNKKESDEKAYIIRHKIEWLEKLVENKLILNQIQFIDLNSSVPAALQWNGIRTFDNIETSEHNYVLDLINGEKDLFSEETARKYQKSQTEESAKSLLIINRIDHLGIKHHFNKIQRQLPILSQKINMNIDEIQQAVKSSKITNEMRNEILYQSFLETQPPEQENSKDRRPLYFLSALYSINKILIQKFETSEDETTKAALNDLFSERNEQNPGFQEFKETANEKNILVMQEYLDDGVQIKLFKNENFLEKIKNTIAKITKEEFQKSVKKRFTEVQNLKDELIRYSFLEKKVFYSQLNKLCLLFESQRNILFLDRFNDIKKSMENLLQDCSINFQEFQKSVSDIGHDSLYVKANEQGKLKNQWEIFRTKWNASVNKFSSKFDSREEAIKINLVNLAKQVQEEHLQKYIENSLIHLNGKLENDSLLLKKKILKIFNTVPTIFQSFVDDKLETMFLVKVFQFYFSHLVGSRAKTLPDIIEKSMEDLKKSERLVEGYGGELNKEVERFQKYFENYQKICLEYSHEKVQSVIQKNL